MPTIPGKKDIELVALDLDGTVMCPLGKQPVSERTKQAVRDLLEAGLAVTFVTGRTEDYALPLVREVGLTTPLVTYNGGRLFCPELGKVLHQSSIEQEDAAAITDWLMESDEVVACYISREGKLMLYQSRCSGDPAQDDYLFGTPRQITPKLSEVILKEGNSVSKLIVVTQRPLETEVPRRFGEVADVVRTHHLLLEMLPTGVSKGSGVERLCRHLDIDPQRVVAVGDQANDIPTFRVCGFSVAMGDAPEAVKEAASYVTGTFEEDGCAQFLERLLGA